MGYYAALLVLVLILSGEHDQVKSDPDDVACLTHFYSAVVDPTHRLTNWNSTAISSACSAADASATSPQGTTCNNGRIFRLSLSNLNLQGSLSPLISKCTNLQTLDLSSNSLTGPIPPDLKDLSNLAVLNLSGNKFSGQIPPSLYLCAYLNVIDLHSNALTGPIPQQLALLVRLNTFDVSYNRLSGMIPPAIGNRTGNSLPRFNATSFVGNKGLYGYPLEPYRNKGLSVMVIVLIGLGSGLLSLIVSFTVVCVWLKVSEQRMAALEDAKISHLMPEY